MAARDLIKIDIQRETADAADTAAGDMGIVGLCWSMVNSEDRYYVFIEFNGLDFPLSGFG